VGKKCVTFFVIAVAVSWMILIGFLASTFPMNQNDAALITGGLCCLILGFVYKVVCDIWRD